MTGTVCDATTSGVSSSSRRREYVAAAANASAAAAPTRKPAAASEIVTSAARTKSMGSAASSASTADGGGKTYGRDVHSAHDQLGAERECQQQAEHRRDGRRARRGGVRRTQPACGEAARTVARSCRSCLHACLPVTKTTKPGPTLRRARAPRIRGHSMRRRHPVHHAGRVGTLSGGRSSGSRIVLRPHLPASELALAVASRSLRPRSQRRVRAGLAPASLWWPSRAPPSAADARRGDPARSSRARRVGRAAPAAARAAADIVRVATTQTARSTMADEGPTNLR